MSAALRLLTAMAIAVAVIAVPLVAASPARAADHSVGITDDAFGTASLTISVGDRVTWTNGGESPHTVTAENGAFDSGTLDAGAAFSFTFTEPGTYAYRCDFHSEMQATIVVEPAASAPQPAAPGTAAPSTAPATDAASHGGNGHEAGQPDTALPAPADMALLTPLLIGLGLVALAFGLLPVRPANVARERRPAGWRR